MTDRETQGTASLLDRLIDKASPEALRDLVRRLVAEHPGTRPTCLDVLGGHLPVGAPARDDAATAAARARWLEADAILAEFDAYGGGEEENEYQLYALLEDLGRQVPDLPRDARRNLLQACLGYIESGNTGMDDSLYDFAHACCPDPEDLRHLAERLEATGQEWPRDHARRIYRSLGDRAAYLRLRLGKMRSGPDFHDLVTFYLEQGERQEAVETARAGLAQAEGPLDELRAFYADELMAAGDRTGALELMFTNLLGRLNPEAYASFRQQCSQDEWAGFERRLLDELPHQRTETRIALHMARAEYSEAAALLADVRYDHWLSGSVREAAAALEPLFPREVLSFYRSGLGNTAQSASRREYERWAHITVQMRRVWVEVMQAPDEWRAFAHRLKALCLRRPAMQEEFDRVLGDWYPV